MYTVTIFILRSISLWSTQDYVNVNALASPITVQIWPRRSAHQPLGLCGAILSRTRLQ